MDQSTNGHAWLGMDLTHVIKMHGLWVRLLIKWQNVIFMDKFWCHSLFFLLLNAVESVLRLKMCFLDWQWIAKQALYI